MQREAGEALQDLTGENSPGVAALEAEPRDPPQQAQTP